MHSNATNIIRGRLRTSRQKSYIYEDCDAENDVELDSDDSYKDKDFVATSENESSSGSDIASIASIKIEEVNKCGFLD